MKKSKTIRVKRISKIQEEINLQQKIRYHLTFFFSIFEIILVVNLLVFTYLKTNVKLTKKDINNNMAALNEKLKETEEEKEELDKLKENNKDKIEAYNKWKEEKEKVKELF